MTDNYSSVTLQTPRFVNIQHVYDRFEYRQIKPAVMQRSHECYLSEFPGYADGPTQAIAAD